jgi:hypothetical protein
MLSWFKRNGKSWFVTLGHQCRQLDHNIPVLLRYPSSRWQKHAIQRSGCQNLRDLQLLAFILLIRHYLCRQDDEEELWNRFL